MPKEPQAKQQARQQELVQVDSPDDMPYEGDFQDEQSHRQMPVKSNVVIDNPDDAEL